MSSNIKIPKICNHCKNGFTAKTTVTQFCSTKCAGKAYKIKKRAEKQALAQDVEYKKTNGIDMELIQSKEYLSIKETCLLLGVSRMTIHRQIKNGTIKTSKLGGRVIIKRDNINYLMS